MAKILDDNFMVCSDCLQAIVNDDYTGLDYSYNEKDAEERMAAIRSGIRDAGGYIARGESEKDKAFSSRACDCCSTTLAGSRHHCIVLGGE